MPRILAVLAAALLLSAFPGPARAAAPPAIEDSGTTLDFPNLLTFRATVEGATDTTEVALEYGVDMRTCGEVTALAFPEFEPGDSEVSWTWDMRQSGSLPPGSTIWYRWRARDSSGATAFTERREVTWLDDTHPWESVSAAKLTLHWYEGDTEFAQELLGAASAALGRLARDIGVTPTETIDLYIYANTEDMRNAVLYEPGWTGGLAYSEHSLTIIGITPDSLDWGKRTVAHELTHVLVGNRAFSCVGSIPTWLNEGIAVYGEGGPEPSSVDQMRAAIASDTLLSVRSLSGAFSEDPAAADLSYVQSYSIVNYLIGAYGQDKLLQMFDRLAAGDAIEPVLEEIYGFGVDGLDQRWRAAIGARPGQAPQAEPTPSPAPSPIPTMALVEPPARGTRPAADQPTPAATTVASAPTQAPPAPSAAPGAAPGAAAPSGPDRGTALLLAAAVGVPLSIGLAVVLLIALTRKRGR